MPPRATIHKVRLERSITPDPNTASTGIATTASKQAKTFASELETLGRNNPFGAMAAAMMVGVLIGLIGRGRI